MLSNIIIHNSPLSPQFLFPLLCNCCGKYNKVIIYNFIIYKDTFVVDVKLIIDMSLV
jgi:hypothetical protein